MKDLILKLFSTPIDPGPIPCALPDGTIDPNCSSGNIVSTIIVWAYVAIGVVAVIILIIAGIQYITSEGEPEKTKRAQSTITYTVIGLIIATAAAAIISFVTGAFR